MSDKRGTWSRMFPWLRWTRHDILDDYTIEVEVPHRMVHVDVYDPKQVDRYNPKGKKIADPILEWSWPWWIRFWTRHAIRSYLRKQARRQKVKDRVQRL